ncbi:polysaccharide deacetylase family protein [Evtepia sp.]|uniref:polysaccharide deacetylase family protein n=1 Tax=Evtepia sp. TaxID=2773933 RepID=UPI003F174E37
MAARKKNILWTLWGIAFLLSLAALLLPAREEAQPVSARKNGGYVALTFDDGPWPNTTEKLLDGLAERGVKATFFLIGSQVEDQRDTVERMAAEGHQIGLHTWDHVQLEGCSQEKIHSQLDPCREALTAIVGPTDFMVRPPYGFVDDNLKKWVDAPIICWSVDTEDWKDKNPARILQVCLDEAEDGAIILMHDIYDTSVEAALQTVDALMAQGYYFVTVEELFALRREIPEHGVVYMDLPPNA